MVTAVPAEPETGLMLLMVGKGVVGMGLGLFVLAQPAINNITSRHALKERCFIRVHLFIEKSMFRFNISR
jgi:hypothetical protein